MSHVIKTSLFILTSWFLSRKSWGLTERNTVRYFTKLFGKQKSGIRAAGTAQCRTVTRLGRQEGQRDFWGAQIFWTMSNSFKIYPTNFSRGGKNFSMGFTPRSYGPGAMTGNYMWSLTREDTYDHERKACSTVHFWRSYFIERGVLMFFKLMINKMVF